ncbi:hypothetical protein SNEBB_001613 [Seison nebaliae]|nr:hypothetical protein SNEBB_001613 [Seison nebaliae]
MEKLRRLMKSHEIIQSISKGKNQYIIGNLGWQILNNIMDEWKLFHVHSQSVFMKSFHPIDEMTKKKISIKDHRLINEYVTISIDRFPSIHQLTWKEQILFEVFDYKTDGNNLNLLNYSRSIVCWWKEHLYRSENLKLIESSPNNHEINYQFNSYEIPLIRVNLSNDVNSIYSMNNILISLFVDGLESTNEKYEGNKIEDKEEIEIIKDFRLLLHPTFCPWKIALFLNGNDCQLEERGKLLKEIAANYQNKINKLKVIRFLPVEIMTNEKIQIMNCDKLSIPIVILFDNETIESGMCKIRNRNSRIFTTVHLSHLINAIRDTFLLRKGLY